VNYEERFGRGRTKTEISLDKIACNMSVVIEGQWTEHKNAVQKSLDYTGFSVALLTLKLSYESVSV
jgi:hypothetical protein